MIIKTKQIKKYNKIIIEYEEGEDVESEINEAIKMLSNMLEYHSVLTDTGSKHLENNQK